MGLGQGTDDTLRAKPFDDSESRGERCCSAQAGNCGLEEGGTDYSAADVVNRYHSLQSHISVLDYMRLQIAQLRAANRLGTAQNYDKTMHSFEAFLGAVKLPLSALTERVIAEYNAFLVQKGLVRNSVSFYMRVLRAVYNKAVRQKLIEQTNPFADVYTSIDRTRKRAVSESVIAQLYRLELSDDSPLALPRDLFVLATVRVNVLCGYYPSAQEQLVEWDDLLRPPQEITIC